MRKSQIASTVATMLVFATIIAAPANGQIEPSSEAQWYLSPGLGRYDYDGGEPVDDVVGLFCHVGYDYSEWWSLDASLNICPSLKENPYGYTDPNPPHTKSTRYPLQEAIGDDSTWSFGAALDGLFHFTRWKRLDPYLSLGGGFVFYGDDFGNGQFDPVARAGGGVMYHFNDEWGLRASGVALIAGNETQANSIIEGGVVWYWDAHIPPNIHGISGMTDTDADGLLDSEELSIGTDPKNHDTDGDGLDDGPEVKQYTTDPLNKDTDADGLMDGLEVYKYKTDPLLRDTDEGGVTDGHEVAEDGTDPLNPADDLILFELYIQFDYDKAIIKPQYFSQLNVIAKVLKRHAGSSASIEGHTDRTKKSSAKYNKALSERRAKAVLNYLSDRQGIAKSRLSAVGYGFERPKITPEDLVNGNPENRRVEVYIRGAGKKQDLIDSGLVNEGDFIITDEGELPENK